MSEQILSKMSVYKNSSELNARLVMKYCELTYVGKDDVHKSSDGYSYVLKYFNNKS